jgi:3-methyladenine DNA glycosylase AlkC
VAKKLKDFFDEAVVRSLARDLRAAHPRFDERAFVRSALLGLHELELTARASKLAGVMRDHLPRDFEAAARVLLASLGPPNERTEDFGMALFRYLPHTIFVARYGLEHFETSMRLQYELTKRFTAEFSIRAFLVRHPDATYERLARWAADPNVHVRRLVSEGTRPRLPWAPRLRSFQTDPEPVLRLLELLKDDEARYVQRSVANNLNDIGKDHPELLLEVCRRWLLNAGPGRKWIVQHALRSLVKKADRRALSLLGFGSVPRLALSAVRVMPVRARIGSVVRFSCLVSSRAKGEQELVVDFAVHFVKSNGARTPKIFKLKKLVLPAGARAPLDGKVSLAELTTRKHYPGRHRIELVINGVEFPIGDFEVRR